MLMLLLLLVLSLPALPLLLLLVYCLLLARLTCCSARAESGGPGLRAVGGVLRSCRCAAAQ